MERLHAVEIRELDVHEHEVRGVFGCHVDGLAPRRRLERSISRCDQDVAEQLHVLLVVLDDEDPLAGHDVVSFAGNAKVKVLPRPSSLSSQIRPPWSSTSRFESARPSPVPSRCAIPASVCWNSSKIRS